MVKPFPPPPNAETATVPQQSTPLASQRSPPATKPAQPAPITNDDIAVILNDILTPDRRHDPTILSFIRSYISTNNLSETAQALRIHPSRARQIRNYKDVWTAITKIRDTASLKYGLDPNEIVERVKEITEFDPISLHRPDGSFVESLAEIPGDARRAIKKFKAKNIYENDPNGMPQVVGKLIEVEFWDKLKASEMLGRETNLFKETKKLELDITSNMKDILLQSRELAEKRALESREALRVIDVSPKAVVSQNETGAEESHEA